MVKQTNHMIGNKYNLKHGLSNCPLYRIWDAMKRRCYNKSHKSYKDYGGRGIIICEEWRNNFKSFYNWAISNGWKKGLKMDRENNDGNYEPANCRIVNSRISSSNTRVKSKYGTCIKIEGKKFRVQINVYGKDRYCGAYETLDRAKEVAKLSILAAELKKS